MDSEARYMRRKVKAGLIEADHDECAIVVHYEVEATVLGEMGEPIVAERQENQKRIKLKTLTENSNIARLAEEIVDKCKLIHASKLPQVERLLKDLQDRALKKARKGGSSTATRRRGNSEEGESDAGEKPSIAKLDQYVERMYDGTEAATQATYMVLQLSRNPENLEALLNNEALVGLLSRLLKEEGRKSMDLAINILYVLYAFSSFSQFHPFLSQSHVGNHILRIIDLETKRHSLREAERTAGPPAAEGDKVAEKRHKLVLRKQEKLLYVCFHVLLNLAEEPEIEKKMSKKDIVGYLAAMLSRQNVELLVLVLMFLKKLSVFKENLPNFKEHGLVPALVPHAAHASEAVAVTALRLLYNLSFEKSSREAMLNGPMLPRVLQLLKKKQQLPLVLRILYNLTVEDKARAAIAKSEAPAALRKQLMSFNEQMLPAELMGLAINLATNASAAEAMCEGSAMRAMLERLYQTHEVLLLKLLRNLAVHEGPAALAAPYVPDLLALIQQVEGEEALLELLGFVSNLRLRRIPELAELVSRYGLLEFLQRHMVPGFTEDDVLLEVIILAGELAADPECAVLLYRFGLVYCEEEEEARGVRSLYALITEKQEDDEFVLQLLFAFYRLLQVDEPRDAMLQQTQIVIYLLDLLLDQNVQIKQMASHCLDAVAEADEQWASQIRQRKFALYNHAWLELVDEDEAEEYQDAVALNNVLQMQQPLDASQLGDEYGNEGEHGEGDSYDGAYGGAMYGGAAAYGTEYGAEGEHYGGEMYGGRAAYGAEYGAEAYGGRPYGGGYGGGYGQEVDGYADDPRYMGGMYAEQEQDDDDEFGD